MKRWIWTNLWKLERRPPQPTSALLNSTPNQPAEKPECCFSRGFCTQSQRRAIQRLFKSWNCHKNQNALINIQLRIQRKVPNESWSWNNEHVFSLRMDWILFHYFYSALLLQKRLLVAFPAKLALQCCFQIFTEMRINFQVVSKLNSLYFKNHQNFVSGSAGNRPTLRLL